MRTSSHETRNARLRSPTAVQNSPVSCSHQYETRGFAERLSPASNRVRGNIHCDGNRKDPVDEIELHIPEGIVESLPPDGEDTKQDMGKAIAGWERELNAAIDLDDEKEAVSAIVDLVEHFENRWEAYDEYVVELRAWGQSPIYAMAWRDLNAAVIQQIYGHDNLSDLIDRERHSRIFEDGIRPGGGSE